MVQSQQRRDMTNFVTALVETARRYDIREQENDHILVVQKSEFAGDPAHPAQIYVALLAGNMTLAAYNRLVGTNTKRGVYTATLFYKDGQTAMVRLGRRGVIKGNDRSLKNYTQDEIDKMVHLRALEARVLQLEKPADTLVYYQPERLAEAVRGYQMRSVTLDYSHLNPEDLHLNPEDLHLNPEDREYGFRVRPQTAKDYRIAEEIYYLLAADSIIFKDTGSGRKILNIVPAPVVPAQEPAAGVAPAVPTQYKRPQNSNSVQLTLFKK